MKEQDSEEPIENLKQFYAILAQPTKTNTRRTRLLMRELLDNKARATNAENCISEGIPRASDWYGKSNRRLTNSLR